MRVYQFRHVGISKQPDQLVQQGSIWCPRRDSNPHTSRHMDLNHARLPIPPRGHINCFESCKTGLVPTEGLEPPHLAAHGPEPCASTNSATWAGSCNHRSTLPSNSATIAGFADLRQTNFRSDFRRLHLRSNPAFGWAVCEESESIADEWQMSKSSRKDGDDTLARTVLGESPVSPLHYACLGVNPTNIAPPACASKYRRRRYRLINIRRQFEAPNSYHSKPRGDSRRFPRCQGAAR
jgi:hypothetical protein